MTYKTPGVYVEEKSSFPPSVAQVATAIPAFVGYTEKAINEEGNQIATYPFIKRIKSFLEYEYYFGKTKSQAFEINVQNGEPVSLASSVTPSPYKMYYALQMYYANGGGPCYIVSVGNQTQTISEADLGITGLAALKKKDEPTLLLFPDAESLPDATKYHSVFKNALAQCRNLGDRFVILDIYNGKDNTQAMINQFRTGIGANFLKYGAAYTPFLKTNINYYAHGGTITFKNAPADSKLNEKKLADIKALISALDYQKIVTAKKTDADAATTEGQAKAAALAAAQAALEAAKIIVEAAVLTNADETGAINAMNDAESALGEAKIAGNQADAIDAAEEAETAVTAVITAAAISVTDLTEIQKIFTTEFENKLKTLLAQQYIIMPPSSAIAGVYAMVDRTKGVWKAPANVSLNRVIGPTAKITDADQESLNIHESGKSINAIRAFTGKGIMVWGARTLAGNDNEWRYISVRRFFNMVEESIKKASEAFVFESNDANTWVKVRAMIENFLIAQWQAGALAGATPTDAFYVKVGLGQTMTAADILNGLMIVEIGMAAVRPAEFIVLRFSHKIQES